MNDIVLSPRIIRRSMNLSILSAVLWSFFGATVGGAIFTGLLRSIELTKPQIGIIMTIPLLFPPLQIFGAYLQRNFFHRKKFWFVCSTTYYSLNAVLIVLVLAWAKIPPQLGFAIFMMIFAMVQIFAQLPASTNLGWLGELVPRRESNAYWNKRTGWAGISGMIAGIAMGKLVDILGRDYSLTYVIVLTLGVIFGYTSTLIFAGVVDPDPAPRPGENFLTLLKETWKNRQYRILTFFFSYQAFFAWLSTGFIFFYLQDAKGMNFSMMIIQVCLAVSSVVAFLSGYLFKIVGAKYGRKPVLILCSVLKAIEFVMWGTMLPKDGFLDEMGNYLIHNFCTSFHLAPMHMPPGFFSTMPVFIFGGFVNMGIASSQMSLLTSLGNKRIQSLAIALFSSIVGLSGVITSFVSGYLYKYLDDIPAIQQSSLNPFNYLALAGALGFLTSVFVLRYFREEGAAPTGDMVRMLLAQNPFRAVYQANILSQPMTEGSRVDTLRKASGNLVANEIAKDFYNPSSRVRDIALLSLTRQQGKLTPELEQDLIKLMDIPELGMQAMAARTLGRLRIEAGVPSLMAKIYSDDLTLAQACVFALGLIGKAEAAPELAKILGDDKARSLWPLAAEALSKVGDYRYTKLIFHAYEVESYYVLRMQCLIAAVRSLALDKPMTHTRFEAEEKLPGSEVESLLKTICADETVRENSPVDFESVIAAYDRSLYLDVASRMIATVLEALKVVENRDKLADSDFIEARFLPGGRIREAMLNATEYVSVNLYLQLKLWSQLKYNAGEGEERHILFAILFLQENLLFSLHENQTKPFKIF